MDFKIDEKSDAQDITALTEKAKKLLSKPIALRELAIKLSVSLKDIRKVIKELQKQHYNVIKNGDLYELTSEIPSGGNHRINVSKFENKVYKIGFVSDTHLNSKYQRLDVLNAIYDIYESEGIKEVYHAGNYVDGEAKFNKYDLINTGISPQIEYFVKEYPQRPGMKTFFIAGDDHEGWWVQREKINIGEYTEMKAREAGRTDLIYLGYIEADVELKAKNGSSVMKIMHPGGGSAYALSYSPQKIIESFTGGEKPAILLLGHYHKADYLPSYRNVHCVQAGCVQDQTPFLRKKKIQAHVGAWILKFALSKDGSVSRFQAEWFSFYDQAFYKKNGYYR